MIIFSLDTFVWYPSLFDLYQLMLPTPQLKAISMTQVSVFWILLILSYSFCSRFYSVSSIYLLMTLKCILSLLSPLSCIFCLWKISVYLFSNTTCSPMRPQEQGDDCMCSHIQHMAQDRCSLTNTNLVCLP